MSRLQKCERVSICCFNEATQFVMLCHGSPNKLTHHVIWLPWSTGDVSLIKILEFVFSSLSKEGMFHEVSGWFYTTQSISCRKMYCSSL